MDEALYPDIDAYTSFNQFFTRALKPHCRPITNTFGAIASPADGRVSQIGDIADGQIIQAKGKHYSAQTLLGGGEKHTQTFMDGKFATIYLSPKDYHRLHMPLTGSLREMIYIPGRLFSVNTATTQAIPGLFARNERVVALFDTEAGPMALVLVGAIFVASIETVWQGVITPPHGSKIRTFQYSQNAPVLQRGEEMGRFNMGSTIIVLFAKNTIHWRQNLSPGQSIKMGELMGLLL